MTGSIPSGRFVAQPWMVIAAFDAATLLYLNSEHGTFRFTPVHLGALSLFVALGLLWVSLLLGVRLRARWARVAAGIGLGLLTFATFLAAPALVFVSSLGYPGTELIQTIRMDGYDLNLYRHNCGAPCHYGLWLHQEWRIAPGIVRVRKVRGWYPAFVGHVARVDANRVRVTVPPYDPDRPETASKVILRLDSRMFRASLPRRDRKGQ